MLNIHIKSSSIFKIIAQYPYITYTIKYETLITWIKKYLA